MAEKFRKDAGDGKRRQQRDRQGNNGQGQGYGAGQNRPTFKPADDSLDYLFMTAKGIAPEKIESFLTDMRIWAMNNCDHLRTYQIFDKPVAPKKAPVVPAAAQAAPAEPNAEGEEAVEAGAAGGTPQGSGASSSSASASAVAQAPAPAPAPAPAAQAAVAGGAPAGTTSQYVPGEYPVIPDPGSDITANQLKTSAGELWKLKQQEYVKMLNNLENDKVRVTGKILGQLDSLCRERIGQCPGGEKAMQECDPLFIIKCIRTELVHPTATVAAKAPVRLWLAANQQFMAIAMRRGESIKQYYDRFKAEAAKYAQICVRAGKEQVSESDLATLFVSSLRGSYVLYMHYVDLKFKPSPETVQDAYTEASTTDWESIHATQLLATGGKPRGAGNVGGAAAVYATTTEKSGDNGEYIPRYRCKCCKQFAGHKARDCPMKGAKKGNANKRDAEDEKNIDRAVKDAKKKSEN